MATCADKNGRDDGIPRQTTSRRRKATRPCELIRAARQVFVEKGFAATRIEDVAEQAGASKGTIYLYFRSKEELFKEVIRAGLAPAVAAVKALAAEADLPPLERLRRFLAIWQRIMAEGPLGDLLRLLAAESGNFPETAQWLRESVVRPGKKEMIGILEAGIARGDFRPINAQIAADVFASPLCLHALRDLWGDLSSPDRFLGEAFGMLIQGLGKIAAE